MRTHLDSASTRRTDPAPERTSSAGGTPRAWRMAAQDSSPFTLDCPAPASRHVTTQPTRCVHPSSWLPPPSIPIFPYQKAEKSPQNQHVLFFNAPSAYRRSSRRFRVCSCYWVRCTRSVGIAPLLFGCIATSRVQRHVTGAAALALFVKAKSWVLWRLVEAASFRVVVCWFSACCGVMPPRARWGRRVLYQWTQAAVSRSTSRRGRV